MTDLSKIPGKDQCGCHKCKCPYCCSHDKRQWDAEGVNYVCLNCGTLGQSDYYQCRAAYQEELSEAPSGQERK